MIDINLIWLLSNQYDYYKFNLIINLIFCILLISLIIGLSHLIISKLEIITKFNNLFRSYYKPNKRFKHVNYSKQQDNVFIITQQCSNDSQSSSEEPLIG